MGTKTMTNTEKMEQFQRLLQQAINTEDGAELGKFMSETEGPGHIQISFGQYASDVECWVIKVDGEIKDVIPIGRAIDAVKSLRRHFTELYGRNLGLKDAKEVIEHVRDHGTIIRTDSWGMFPLNGWGKVYPI